MNMDLVQKAGFDYIGWDLRTPLDVSGAVRAPAQAA